MKRFIIWIIILLLGLVAFKNDSSIEISDRTLVHAIGIDEDDSGCTVTLQIFKTDGSGTDTVIDPSQTNTRVISNTAPTFEEAMSLCESQLGNYLFIGHNQVIVIGHDTDLSEPSELLSYFIRNKDSFLGVKVVLSETTAKDILNVQIPTGTITMENFTEIIDMYNSKGTAIPSTMVEFINESRKPDKALILPVVSVINEEHAQSENSGDGSDSSQQSGEATLIAINKNALIKNGRIIKELDTQQAQSINLIRNRNEYGMININYEGTDFGVNLIKRSHKPRIDIHDNRIFYSVDISLIGNTVNSSFSQSDKDKIAKLVEQKLKQQCEDAFNELFFEYDADVFDLSRLIRFHYPKVYLEYIDNYDLLKANTVFSVNIKCTTK